MKPFLSCSFRGLLFAALLCSGAQSWALDALDNLPPKVVLKSPVDGLSLRSPSVLKLGADASDPENRLKAVVFYINGEPVVSVPVLPDDARKTYFETSWNVRSFTTFPVKLIVHAGAIDREGRRGTSEPVTVTLTGPNSIPLVNLTAPDKALSITSREYLLKATATDREGVARVEFLAGGKVIGTDERAPFEFLWKEIPAGRHAVQARAVDADGASATSLPVVLTVNAGKAPVVAVTAPVPGELLLAGDGLVGLSARVSDPDGTIVKVEFLVGDQVILPQANLTVKDQYSGAFRPEAAGRYTVRVRAMDNQGNTSVSEEVPFEVYFPERPPELIVSLVSRESVLPGPDGVIQVRSDGPADLLFNVSISGAARGSSVKRVELLLNGKSAAVVENPPSQTRVQLTAKGVPYGLYEVLVKSVDSRGVVGIGMLPRSARIRVVPLVAFSQISEVLIEPASNSLFRSETIGGDVVIRSTASPVAALQVVELYLDGEKALNLSPAKVVASRSRVWSIPFELKGLRNGSHTLHAVLRGVEGGVLYSRPVSIVVVVFEGGLVTQITSPKPRTTATVGETIEVAATAKPAGEGRPAEVASVQFLLKRSGQKDVVLKTDTRSPYSTTWKPESEGVYTLLAIARTPGGKEYPSAPVTVDVKPQPISAAIALTSPKKGANYSLGQVVPVAAKVEVKGVEVKSVQFLARLDGKSEESLKVDSTSPYSVEWKPKAAGKYRLRAVLSLANGKTVESPEIAIAVGDGNKPPAVEILSPKSGGKFELGEPISFTVKASDPDGSVAEVRYFIQGELVAVVPKAPYSLLWSLSRKGEHKIVAMAVDNRGAKTESEPVVVTMVDPNEGNRPPKVDIVSPASGSTHPAGTVKVKVQAADADGYIPKVELWLDGKLAAQESRVFVTKPRPGELAEFELSIMITAPGAHVLSAKAFDDRGSSTTSSAITLNIGSVTVVQVEALQETLLESGEQGAGGFKISRSGTGKLPLVVRYTIRGTATAGIDFKAVPETASIPPGESSVVVKIDPVPDKALEGKESVTLSLMPGTSSGSPAVDSAYRLGEKSSATLWIVENGADAVKRTLVNVFPEPEVISILGDRSGHFVFTRSGDLSVPVDVLYQVSGTADPGVHYEKLSGKITFPKGESKVRQSVVPKGASFGQLSRSIIVTLEPAVCIEIFPPPPSCYLIGPDGKATLHVVAPIAIGSTIESVDSAPPGILSLKPIGLTGLLGLTPDELYPVSIAPQNSTESIVTFYGASFRTYLVESSDDEGRTWLPVAVVNSGTGLFFLDVPTPTPSRVYRATRIL